MDAFSCCWENEVVLRDGKLVQNPTRVACYEFDIIDLKESIESGDASQQLKEFIKAYFDTNYFQTLIKQMASTGSTRDYVGITAQQDLELILDVLRM